MSGCKELLTILPTLLLDVTVPFVDNVSDLSLIFEWYNTGHWKYATSLLIPFLLNVIGTIYHWWKWDSKTEKKYTWFLIILQLWPIYRAIKLAIKVWKRLPGVEAEKNKFEGEVLSLEPYLESLPSVFVMAFALIYEYNKCNESAVIGESPKKFAVTFVISILSSALGISKYLLRGPFRVLTNDGFLNGMLTGRFFFLFIAILISVVTKVTITISVTVGFYINFISLAGLPVPQFYVPNVLCNSTVEYNTHPIYYIPALALSFGVMILPPIIMSICCILRATGYRKLFFKFVSGNPQICFLPVFTHFAIGNRSLKCMFGPHNETKKRQLGLSIELTIVNMILNFSAGAVCCGIFRGIDAVPNTEVFDILIFYLSGITLTCTFLCFGSQYCCQCCKTKSNAKFFAVSYQYVDPINTWINRYLSSQM